MHVDCSDSLIVDNVCFNTHVPDLTASKLVGLNNRTNMSFFKNRSKSHKVPNKKKSREEVRTIIVKTVAYVKIMDHKFACLSLRV